MAYRRGPARARYRSSGSSRRRGSSNRSTIWIRQRHVQGGVHHDNPALATLTPSTSLDLGAVVGGTVTRVRGTIEVATPLGRDPNTGGFTWACALWDPTFTPLVKPAEDMNQFDWFAWSYVPLTTLPNVYFQLGTGATQQWFFGWNIDVKSARRVGVPGVLPMLFVQPDAELSADVNMACTVAVTTSTLFRLS